MHISFYPPLGTHTRVPVNTPTVNLKDDQCHVRATLTARLSPQDYAEVVKTGLRIEAWTNAPTDARPTGEWGPIAFVEVEDDVTVPNGGEDEPCFSLDGNDEVTPLSPPDAQASKTHVFRAALLLPRNPGWVFAFTYRLVYPSGICWLGSDRDNGVLELDASTAFLEEVESWEAREGQKVFLNVQGPSQEADEGNLVIGKLDVTEWSWAGWATDGSRVWSFNDSCLEPIEDARLAFLVPAALTNSVLLPQAFVFHASSKNTRFAITAQGHVVLISGESGTEIACRAHDSSSQRDLDLLRNEIVSSFSAPHFFPTKDLDTLLFAPRYDSDVSLTLYAETLTRTGSPFRSISLPMTTLDAFAKQSAAFSFYIPETRKAVFVDRSNHPENLWLRFGSGAAQVVISAVYELTSTSDSHLSYHLSLPEGTTAAERAMLSDTVENPLPTPPASPRTKPQRSVSFVLPSESEKDGETEHPKPVGRSTPVPERNAVARQFARSNSAFERYQAVSGAAKIKVVVSNVLKLIARFMGVAVLRLMLFAFRLIGIERQPEVKSPRAQIDARKDSGISSVLTQDRPASELDIAQDISSGRPVADVASSAEMHMAESRQIPSGSALSTEPREEEAGIDVHQERSMPGRSAASPVLPALKWILPPGDESPIRLLVHSDVAWDDIFKHLSIELNGEDVGKTWSVHVAGNKTSIVEIGRPEGITSTLLVKLTS